MNHIIIGNELLKEFYQLCQNCEERFWVVSPFLGSWKGLEKIIGNILSRRLNIKLITDVENKTCIDKKTIEKFINVGEVKTLNMLHAKIYIIDNKALITSANLSETAFFKRYEIGYIVDFDEIEEFFNYLFKIAKKINIMDIKNENYIYNENCEINNHKFNHPKLWRLPTLNKNTLIRGGRAKGTKNGKITLEMREEAYKYAKDVYSKKIKQKDAVEDYLIDKFGFNLRTANIMIDNLKHMLNGKLYSQTMSKEATEYYMNNIFKDFGKDALKNAILAYEKHVEYCRTPKSSKKIVNKQEYAEDLIKDMQNKYLK